MSGFFRRLFGLQDDQPKASPSPTSQPPRWREAPSRTLTEDIGHRVVLTTTFPTGPHGFVSVVGESFHQDVLRTLAVRLGSDAIFSARLVPEPLNPHDANAVAVCVNDDLAKIGYLARDVAEAYHAPLAQLGRPVTCPARLSGVDGVPIGVVLDFEAVRQALGLSLASVDHGDIDYDASAEYHRLYRATRLLVNETRPLEASDPPEAVARYRRALTTLSECRELARVKGLDAHGYALNQTDAIPIDRLTRCLVAIGNVEEASKELDTFVEVFPHAADMTLVKSARERIHRARGGVPTPKPKRAPRATQVSTVPTLSGGLTSRRPDARYGQLDLGGVDALQANDVDAEGWNIADGPERVVTITSKSWQHFEPDLPKGLDNRFYNEMTPVHVVRVLQKYVTIRTPAKRADELWRAIDVAYHRREQAPETRLFAELLMERFATQHREADRPPHAYVWHAKLLEERQRWDEAVAVLTGAITLGINDGTARGFAGRLEALQRKAKRAARSAPATATARTRY